MPTFEALLYYTMSYGQPQRDREREWDRERERQPFGCTIQIIHLLFHYGARGGADGWGTVLQAARSGVQFLLHRADSLNTFMCQVSSNLGPLTSWNPQGLYRGCFTFFFTINTQRSHLSLFFTTVLVMWVLKSSISTSHKIRFMTPSVPGFSKS